MKDEWLYNTEDEKWDSEELKVYESKDFKIFKKILFMLRRILNYLFDITFDSPILKEKDPYLILIGSKNLLELETGRILLIERKNIYSSKPKK